MFSRLYDKIVIKKKQKKTSSMYKRLGLVSTESRRIKIFLQQHNTFIILEFRTYLNLALNRILNAVHVTRVP